VYGVEIGIGYAGMQNLGNRPIGHSVKVGFHSSLVIAIKAGKASAKFTKGHHTAL
jgi:hypothetical protein